MNTSRSFLLQTPDPHHTYDMPLTHPSHAQLEDMGAQLHAAQDALARTQEQVTGLDVCELFIVCFMCGCAGSRVVFGLLYDWPSS